MTYKEFLKSEVERASKNSWFDIEGNSPLAMANRNFMSELKKQFNGFNYDIKNTVDFKELLFQVVKLILLITIPITYIPFLLARTFFARKKSRLEMRIRFIELSSDE